MERDLEKIEELYRAQQKRDIRSILMLMSPDIEIIQSTELPWGGSYLGHDGVKKFLTTLSEHIDSQVHVERLIDAGEKSPSSATPSGKLAKPNSNSISPSSTSGLSTKARSPASNLTSTTQPCWPRSAANPPGIVGDEVTRLKSSENGK